MASLRVLYTCRMCKVKDVPVYVPVRGTNEDVVEWMHGVTAFLMDDHSKRSPRCKANKFDEVKVPMQDGNDRVGGSPVN